MIPRYTRPEMARIWSDENRFRTWLAVEVAATETLAEAGMVPKDAAKATDTNFLDDLKLPVFFLWCRQMLLVKPWILRDIGTF